MEDPTLIQLPREVLEEILLGVPAKKFPDICTISSLFHTFCNDETFWKRKTNRDFPTHVREGKLPKYVANYRELYARLAIGNIKYFPIIYNNQSYPSAVRDGVWLTKDMDIATVYYILAKQGDNKTGDIAGDYKIFGVSQYNLYALNLEAVRDKWFGSIILIPKSFSFAAAKYRKYGTEADVDEIPLSVMFADVTYWHISTDYYIDLTEYERFKVVEGEIWISDLWITNFRNLLVGDFLKAIVQQYPETRTVSVGVYDYNKSSPVTPGNPVGVSNEIVWLRHFNLEKERDSQEDILKILTQKYKASGVVFFVVELNNIPEL